jgi:hypothetical protein
MFHFLFKYQIANYYLLIINKHNKLKDSQYHFIVFNFRMFADLFGFLLPSKTMLSSPMPFYWE